MFKKSLITLAVAGALLLSGATAANASAVNAGYTGGGGGVSDPTPGLGQSITLTVNVTGNNNTIYFVIINSPGGAQLGSLVKAAVPSGGVTKPVVNGASSAVFSSDVEGTHVVGAYDEAGNQVATFSLPVDDANGDFRTAAVGGSTGVNADGSLPATGGAIPLTALWIGAGALGLGSIATVAAVARRRAHASN